LRAIGQGGPPDSAGRWEGQEGVVPPSEHPLHRAHRASRQKSAGLRSSCGSGGEGVVAVSVDAGFFVGVMHADARRGWHPLPHIAVAKHPRVTASGRQRPTDTLSSPVGFTLTSPPPLFPKPAAATSCGRRAPSRPASSRSRSRATPRRSTPRPASPSTTRSAALSATERRTRSAPEPTSTERTRCAGIRGGGDSFPGGERSTGVCRWRAVALMRGSARDGPWRACGASEREECGLFGVGLREHSALTVRIVLARRGASR
jgi:hypothetical protein